VKIYLSANFSATAKLTICRFSISLYYRYGNKTDMIGQTVSHYKILEKLGEGGMGVVYKARDTRLDRTVALKFLPEHLLDDSSAKARFIQEAKGASAINHQNITTVHDIGEVDGKSFIAMEYLEGKTVKELAKENLKLNQVLEIAIQIAEGLAAAHKKEIIHRDIKSDNIMVTNDNVVKIMDFGLAKLKSTSKLTESGATVGTIAYMSPEQTKGEAIDHRSDIFSLGAVLYELITARSPFQGDHNAAISYSICYENPDPLARYKSNVPDGLQKIVDKALKKDKSIRYQSAADLLADLKGLQKEIIIVDTKSHAKRKMLAVLPFENLGLAEDEYFADGITDEIITNLAKVSGLGVISRTSAIKYKKTDKSLRQIAAELGVDYVLEGTIRWDKSGNANRVRITPQLIGVKDDTHLWAETYDRVLEQIFALQSDIAEKVTQALHIALLDPEQRYLEARPTDNLEAYNYYLRGNDNYNRGYTEKDYQMAAEMYQKAVEIEPTFALAYAKLSLVHTLTYWKYLDRTEERFRKAKEAVDKALQLNPHLPEAHLSLGYYYYHGNLDYNAALEQFDIAQKSQPNNAELLSAIGYVQRRQGKFDQAVANHIKSAELDPRSAVRALDVGATYVNMRNYPEAERYFDRAISLAPDWILPYYFKALLYVIWEGSTVKANKVLQEAAGKVDPPQLPCLWFEFDLLDGNYRKALERLPVDPNKFISFAGGTDTLEYFLCKAQVHGLLNQPQLEQACYDSARNILETRIQTHPQDTEFHIRLGIVYAGLGRKEEAIKEGKKALELLPVTKDAIRGPELVAKLAQIYVKVGDYDSATDQLEYLLSIPTSFVSVPYLRIDPTWAPLRNHPRFQKLIKQG